MTNLRRQPTSAEHPGPAATGRSTAAQDRLDAIRARRIVRLKRRKAYRS